MFIKLGMETTKGGRSYLCHFFPEDGLVQVSGPIPEPGNVGALVIAFKTTADSEEEARKKITEAIEQGILS